MRHLLADPRNYMDAGGWEIRSSRTIWLPSGLCRFARAEESPQRRVGHVPSDGDAMIFRRWWYWRRMAKIDRRCAKRGHQDYGCWSVSGALGVECGYCGRILWTRRYGEEFAQPQYQAPTRAAESNWQ